MRLFLLAVMLLAFPAGAAAQFKEQGGDKGAKLDREATSRIRIGLIVKATGGTVQRIIATAPVPTEWPEQQVRIVTEDVSPSVKNLTYRAISGGGGLKQMVVEIPQLLAGQEAKALVTFEVTRSVLLPPTDTSIYKIPKKVDRQTNLNLGTSPYIESRHPKIIAAAKEAVGDADTDWKKVEAIYEWVRGNISNRHGEMKGAARALFDKTGGADELASLFIAMCRAQKIPARTVFVFGHCYAEFYLDDDEGQGHWFPCQTAGVRAFGGTDDVRPIMQKGDNFKNPENPKERQRFVTEYFTAAGRGGEPKVQFICEPVAE